MLRFKRKESHDGHSLDATCSTVDRFWAFPIQLRHVRSILYRRSWGSAVID